MTRAGVCTSLITEIPLHTVGAGGGGGLTPSGMCGGISYAGSIFILLGREERERVIDGSRGRQGGRRERKLQESGRRRDGVGGAGPGGGVRVSCQLPPSIILSWRGNQYSSLFVLSPNVLNLEKKEQNPDKCILFSNSKCCIRFHPHADATASSRLLSVPVAGLGCLPPPLAGPAASTDGATEMNYWLVTGGHLPSQEKDSGPFLAGGAFPAQDCTGMTPDNSLAWKLIVKTFLLPV